MGFDAPSALPTETPGIPLDDSRITEPVGGEVGSTLGSQIDEASSHTEPDPSEDEILGDLLLHEIQESEKQEKLLNGKK